MPYTNASRTSRGRAGIAWSGTFALLLASGFAGTVAAQARIGGHTRLERFGIDLGYGVLMGLAFAAYDQARNDPPQWGNGASGYGRRAASNIGGFVIEEGVTEGLAAAMNRPLDYTHCKCQGFGPRTWHALLGGVTDEMPGGSRQFAVPRVVGAYVGSFAQSAWRPHGSRNWLSLGLGRGTASLAIGAGINLFHEFVK
jgi:hypothetical protein